MRQKALRSSTAAIVGVGAIGCASAGLLARAGIGSITLIDRDFVEPGNLQRQSLYSKSDVGMPKAIAAKKSLEKVNPYIEIEAIVADLDYKNINLLTNHDIILDCTDNFETRYLINDFCRKSGIPWVYAAVIRDAGTVFSILPEGPCFMCAFPRHYSTETCDTAGVSNAAVVVTAALQASQAIRILLGMGSDENMMRVNLHQAGVLRLKVRKDLKCRCCRGNYDFLSGKRAARAVKLCGTNSYQVKGNKVNLKQLELKLRKSGISVKNSGYCLHFSGMTLFGDGRAIIKAGTPEKARSLYSKLVGN